MHEVEKTFFGRMKLNTKSFFSIFGIKYWAIYPFRMVLSGSKQERSRAEGVKHVDSALH
jgi:hypothetical protein